MICIYKEIERGIESVSDVIRNLCIYLGELERARNNKAIEQKDRKLFFSITYSTEISR